MSWSISYENREQFEKDERHFQSTDLSPDAEEQVAAAREAVKVLIKSGAVGPEGKDFGVSINGHSNPGHEPTPGWVKDCIGVNVYQK